MGFQHDYVFEVIDHMRKVLKMHFREGQAHYFGKNGFFYSEQWLLTVLIVIFML